MTEVLKQWLDHFSPQAQAAIIAALVGLLTGSVGPALRHWLDRWSLRHRLRTEHEYAERKKLRSLIGSFHGRVLEAAESFNHRLWNLRENQGEGWMALAGRYEDVSEWHYFRTTIHRMIELLSYLKTFQDKAIFIDARIAEKSDLLFLKYAKALEWTLTDVALFKGLDYDANMSTDHLFRGHLRVACEACTSKERPLSLLAFENCLREGDLRKELLPFYRFFDGLAADGRLRWDRIIVFHLVLCSFINAFGYPMQRTSVKQLAQIATSVNEACILQNVLEWLDKLGIRASKEGRILERTLRLSVKARS